MKHRGRCGRRFRTGRPSRAAEVPSRLSSPVGEVPRSLPLPVGEVPRPLPAGEVRWAVSAPGHPMAHCRPKQDDELVGGRYHPAVLSGRKIIVQVPAVSQRPVEPRARICHRDDVVQLLAAVHRRHDLARQRRHRGLPQERIGAGLRLRDGRQVEVLDLEQPVVDAAMLGQSNASTISPRAKTCTRLRSAVPVACRLCRMTCSSVRVGSIHRRAAGSGSSPSRRTCGPRPAPSREDAAPP